MTNGNKKPAFHHGHGWVLGISTDFVETLRINRFDGLDQIMAFAGGEVMRSVPGRSTVRIQLKTARGGTLTAYLKRYEPHYLTAFRKLLRWIRWPGAADEALHEWNALYALNQAGFNTPTPIAFGQRRRFGLVMSSFLLTAEITGGIAAHDYSQTLNSQNRRVLTLSIAELTRRFLAAGFAHRDFYLSHIFVVDAAATSTPELYLIDLQRLFKPRFLRKRWLVKDLAALGYTAQLAGATRGDLMAFYLRCFEISKLGNSDKRLIRNILRRIQQLHGRAPKYDVIWDQPGIHPPNV